MEKQTEAFKNDKVLLWGLKPANKKLLLQYDFGNKNPKSTKPVVKKEKEEKKPIKEVVREFSLNEDYNVKDLPFLNKENDRLDKYLNEAVDLDDEYDRISELQEKLGDLIEGLEAMEKFQGTGMLKKEKEYIEPVYNNTVYQTIKGKGYAKGSPEAKEWAARMKAAREAKKPATSIKKPIEKNINKARIEKGGEQAKSFSERMKEARQKKASEKVVLKVVPKKSKKKPWYYIGDIPRGYREATDDEAIKANKINEFGKYEVDSVKYELYNNYGLLLSESLTNVELRNAITGTKKKILNAFNEIEIYTSKVDNPKYKGELNKFTIKLEDAITMRKRLQQGFNWLLKLYSERQGTEYKKVKIEPPKKYVPVLTPSTYKIEEKVIIDPRTNKPVDNTPEEPEEPTEMNFIRGKERISLKRTYFNDDYTLKPKYAKQLFEKKIILEPKFYSDKEKNNLFYKMNGSGLKGKYKYISGGSLTTYDLKNLLDASYDNKQETVNDFVRDDSISSKTSKVYTNPETGQVVVAHKGTQGIMDWGNNIVYALGGTKRYKETPRYKEALKVQNKASEKYGNENISTIGHSQGGLQAELLGENTKEIITLNKATKPFNNKKKANQIDIFSTGDIVHKLNPFQKRNKQEISIKLQSLNLLKEHSPEVLNRLDKNRLIGKK